MSMILQLLRPRLSASISMKAPPLSEHPEQDVPRAIDASSRHVVHAGLVHEVAEARALDTMAARCRERKWSRGSHGEVITETKHGPCEQILPDMSALRYTEISSTPAPWRLSRSLQLCTVILPRIEDVTARSSSRKKIARMTRRVFRTFRVCFTTNKRWSRVTTKTDRSQICTHRILRGHTSIGSEHAVVTA